MRSAVPFIGFISERELREREERRAGSISGGEYALPLAAGTPPIAPQPQHGLSCLPASKTRKSGMSVSLE